MSRPAARLVWRRIAPLVVVLASAPATAAGGAVAAGAASAAEATGDFEPPQVIRFGASLGEMEQALAPRCKSLDTRRIDPPFLPDVRDRQMQIDCDGLAFRGQPRWAELVFRDDELVAVWILTTAEEEARLLAAMTAAYGEPSHRDGDWFGFVEHLAALRRDKPEVLFYSPALDEVYREWFADNVGD